jgi:hypothetical protein|tara:strand:- start:12995 stop:13447 length:453 start_codon:yes stop_codon:yes gene_type:complete
MKRIKGKSMSVAKSLRKKVVVNEKLVPKGHFCYAIIPDSKGTIFDEDLQGDVPTLGVKYCPYLDWKSVEDDNENGYRGVHSHCSLLGVFLYDQIKECGVNVCDARNKVVDDEDYINDEEYGELCEEGGYDFGDEYDEDEYDEDEYDEDDE